MGYLGDMKYNPYIYLDNWPVKKCIECKSNSAISGFMSYRAKNMKTIKSAYQHAPLSNIESLIILHEPILTRTIKTHKHTHI